MWRRTGGRSIYRVAAGQWLAVLSHPRHLPPHQRRCASRADPYSRPMTVPPGHLAHFAINADDVTAARTFYGAVFGWTFEPWE